jgi:hypothetical protein
VVGDAPSPLATPLLLYSRAISLFLHLGFASLGFLVNNQGLVALYYSQHWLSPRNPVKSAQYSARTVHVDRPPERPPVASRSISFHPLVLDLDVSSYDAIREYPAQCRA